MRIGVLLASLVFAISAHAATLNVVDGQLMGASGVLVDGNLYDVEFLDGTCIDLFSGCNESSDFTFNSWQEAQVASQALDDQLFNAPAPGPYGLPDVPLDLINGIDPDQERMWIITPYYNSSVYEFALITYLECTSGYSGYLCFNAPSRLENNLASPLPSDDTTTIPAGVYASWSLVPEPSTVMLVSLGLAGFAAKARRRNRS